MNGPPPPGVPVHEPIVPRTIVDGRYRIERVVGEGSFGRVYLAFDTRLRNHVAIKELLASRSAADRALAATYLERFQREGRAVFALQHPNVVSVYEMHEDTVGNHYLAMEYVDGPNLRDLLLQVGTLAVERIVAIAMDLARALDAIEERGIVHRDIKPANIMLNTRGVAKLADFGVALIPSETMTRPVGARHPGSPAYMSPEQATGSGPVDGRSDLYGLGLIMYEMATGRRYTAGSQPLGMMRPDLPSQLATIVGKLLQTNPAWRYQTAEELLRDLGELSSAPAVQPSMPAPLVSPAPARPPMRRKWPIFGVAGIVLVALATVLATQVWRGPAPAPTAAPVATTTPAPTASTVLTRVAAQETPTDIATATITTVVVTLAPPATVTVRPVPPTLIPTPTPPPPTATPVRPTNTPTPAPVARVPLGAAPPGWKTYSGTPRTPFAIFYPPNWTVDESNLAKDGRILFKGADGSPILALGADTTRTTTSIDTLRDQQAKAVTSACVRSGVEGTDQVTAAGGVVFAELLEVCDQKQGPQLVWLIGVGLNDGYQWYFQALSFRSKFNKNTCGCPSGDLESYFTPMLNSIRIYDNPVG